MTKVAGEKQLCLPHWQLPAQHPSNLRLGQDLLRVPPLQKRYSHSFRPALPAGRDTIHVSPTYTGICPSRTIFHVILIAEPISYLAKRASAGLIKSTTAAFSCEMFLRSMYVIWPRAREKKGALSTEDGTFQDSRRK